MPPYAELSSASLLRADHGFNTWQQGDVEKKKQHGVFFGSLLFFLPKKKEGYQKNKAEQPLLF